MNWQIQGIPTSIIYLLPRKFFGGGERNLAGSQLPALTFTADHIPASNQYGQAGSQLPLLLFLTDG
jgi:hypothetical protein